ncbi:MAG: hypothetical protein M1815_001519 [Lichina confinis]|nr:MAG: hypothetical protein M1815_001519 [Lichina confinis]
MSTLMFPDRLNDLSDKDIDSLTNILSQPIQSANPRLSFDDRALKYRRQAIKKLVQGLPSDLLRPIPMQTKVVNFLAKHMYIPPASFLCDTHKRLNSQIVRYVLVAIEIEIGKRLNSLILNMSALSTEHKKLISSLRALNALWTPPHDYRQNFLCEPEQKWRYQEDDCGACMLARIGEDEGTLLLLRTTLLARMQPDLADPRLLRWVEGWVSWSGRGDEIRAESKKLAKSLRPARKTAREVRLRRSRPVRAMSMIPENTLPEQPKLITGPADAEDDNEDAASDHSDNNDWAESILNGYAPSSSRYASNMVLGRHPDAAADSAVRQDSRSSIAASIRGGPRASSQSRAEEYQSLLRAMPESTDQGWTSRLSLNSRVTRWSDLIIPPENQAGNNRNWI